MTTEANGPAPTQGVITKDNILPQFEESFSAFRKMATTYARRMEGPFIVETREGLLTCEDGWLALDSGGWPYPIAADEFARIYTEAE